MDFATTTTDRLAETLAHCARRVPLYREVDPPRADEDPCAALRRFPILTKERLRAAFPHALVPEGESLARALGGQQIAFVGTSGTTGERVQVLWHQPWWDAQERDGFAAHALAGELVGRAGYREAVLTTPVCSGNLCHVAALPMQERIDGHVLFLNQMVDPSFWSDADVLRMADELDTFAPTALEAAPSYLAHFALRLARLGRRPRAPAFIDLSYELVSRRHRIAIARVFDVPILDAYGSTECGFVFCQCEHGAYHHNARWSHVEIVPCAPLPGIGALLVTPLENPWLNLVRFETGDLVRMGARACACGRDGLVLASIEGRAKDLLVGASGGLVTTRAIDDALAAVAGLLHYRVVQSAPRAAELELLPDEHDPLDAGAARDALGALLGFAPRVRVVRSVPVEASGKARLSCATHVDTAALARAAR